MNIVLHRLLFKSRSKTTSNELSETSPDFQEDRTDVIWVAKVMTIPDETKTSIMMTTPGSGLGTIVTHHDYKTTSGLLPSWALKGNKLHCAVSIYDRKVPKNRVLLHKHVLPVFGNEVLVSLYIGRWLHRANTGEWWDKRRWAESRRAQDEKGQRRKSQIVKKASYKSLDRKPESGMRKLERRNTVWRPVWGSMRSFRQWARRHCVHVGMQCETKYYSKPST